MADDSPQLGRGSADAAAPGSGSASSAPVPSGDGAARGRERRRRRAVERLAGLVDGVAAGAMLAFGVPAAAAPGRRHGPDEFPMVGAAVPDVPTMVVLVECRGGLAERTEVEDAVRRLLCRALPELRVVTAALPLGQLPRGRGGRIPRGAARRWWREQVRRRHGTAIEPKASRGTDRSGTVRSTDSDRPATDDELRARSDGPARPAPVPRDGGSRTGTHRPPADDGDRGPAGGPAGGPGRGPGRLVAGRVDGPFADPSRPPECPPGVPRVASAVGTASAAGGAADRGPAAAGPGTTAGPLDGRRPDGIAALRGGTRRLRAAGVPGAPGILAWEPLRLRLADEARLELGAGVIVQPGVELELGPGASLVLRDGVRLGPAVRIRVRTGTAILDAGAVIAAGVCIDVSGVLRIGRCAVVGPACRIGHAEGAIAEGGHAGSAPPATSTSAAAAAAAAAARAGHPPIVIAAGVHVPAGRIISGRRRTAA